MSEKHEQAGVDVSTVYRHPGKVDANGFGLAIHHRVVIYS